MIGRNTPQTALVHIPALMRRVDRLIAAHEADSWKGSGDPDDIPEIEHELLAAQRDLDSYLYKSVKRNTERIRRFRGSLIDARL